LAPSSLLDRTIYGTCPIYEAPCPSCRAKFPVVFYRTRAGTEVVRDWLKGLSKEDRDVIGQDLMRLQYRWPVGMPLCRSLGQGLWEVRSNLTSNRIARVLVFFTGERIVALHGFVKKTQKTPPADLALALKRKREFERDEE
jgi:phage-related protein